MMPGRWAMLPLLAVLPLVGRAAYVLTWLATRDARLARFLAPGVALAGWLLSIHAIGLASHSFYAGLVAGTLLLAAIGAASFRVRVPPDPAGEKTSVWMWVGVALVAPLLLGPEFAWSKHDECLLTGHISIPAEMQNGIYPPRHLTFPAFELRYHYAIDLAAAAVSTLLGRLDVAATVHGLAVVLWAYTFCLYWLLGERLVGGRAGGPVTATCVLFAGGAPYFCQPPSLGLDYLTSMCKVGGSWITPPLVSNFVQHPWSLGIPLFAIVLLLAIRIDAVGASRWTWIALTVATLALSFAQVVLFLCTVPSLVAAGSFEGRRVSGRKLGRLAAWAVVTLAAARSLHGFFAPSLEPAQGRIELHPFWLDASASQWLGWHAQAFGALLPLGVAGLWFLRKQRVLLALLAAGSLLVRDAFRFVPGWNIVKFSMVTQLVLALMAAATLAAGFSRPRWRIPAAAGLLLCTIFGIAWPLALSWARPKHRCLPPSPAGADAEAIDFLRRHVREGEGVYRSERADAYAVFGGLPQPTWDWGTEAFGFTGTLFDERRRMLQHPDDPDVLARDGFRWLVVAPGDVALLAASRRWTQDGRAEVAAEFPPLVVVHLK